MARALLLQIVALLALAGGALGCSVKVVGAVAPPTAVERQLLGAYEQLDRRLVHVSSLRGGRPGVIQSFSALESQALVARRIQRFNEDDLAQLKSAGCIAESLQATVVARPCAAADPAQGRRLKRVLSEENRARGDILEWAAYARAREQGKALPSAAERRALVDAYVRLMRAAARPGDLFEVRPGVFEPVRMLGEGPAPAGNA